MSEHITHTAVMDDGARLAIHSPEICGDFKTVLRGKIGICRYTAMTRSGDMFTVRLLQGLRNHWPGRQAGDLSEEKLAFVLGWRCHLAADRTFKPVFRQLDPEYYRKADDERGGASDVSIYHDVTVFREVYSSGREQPFSPSMLDFRLESHPAFRSMPVSALEGLVLPLWQQLLLNAQSRRDLAHFQARRIDLARYAAAYHSPDPDKLRRYIVEPNFYDPEDGLIALARSIQRGAARTSISLKEALAAAPRQSQYAQALERAYRYLHAASEYFVGRIDERELQIRCDVGKPHVPAELDPRRKS